MMISISSITSQVGLSTVMAIEANVSNVTAHPTGMVSMPSPEDMDFYSMVKFYLLAIIIPIGLVFNLLSCAVFLRSRMRMTATVFYFFALACADNFVLLGEFLWWLNSVTSKKYITGLNFMDTIDGVCKFVHFLRYFGRLFSSWLVVSICIERFITVAYPFRSTWSSTLTKAKLVVAGLALICAVLSCPAFFAVGTRFYNGLSRCLIVENYLHAYKHWLVIVMTAGELVIPSILVIIFTALIISKLVQARRRFSTRRQNTVMRRNNDNNNKQATIALLAVSIAFITLRTPYVIVYPLFQNWKTVFPNQTKWHFLQLFAAYNISFVLAVTNYAVNFLLYIVTGKTFRSEFVRILLCRKSDHASSRTSRTYSTISQSTMLSRQSSYNNSLRKANDKVQEKNGSIVNRGTPPATYVTVNQNSEL